jgi:hypothetical protein
LKQAEQKKRKTALNDRFGDRIPETRRPEAALWSGYDEFSDEPPDPDIASSWFSSFIVLKQVDGRRFGLESTLQLTQGRNGVRNRLLTAETSLSSVWAWEDRNEQRMVGWCTMC